MIKRSHTSPKLSELVEFPLAGTMVVTAGQVADNRDGDILTQTADTLAKIDRLLAEAGTDKLKIAYAYVWLPDIKDFDAMNSVWEKWVPQGAAPARACVEARLADPRLKVEIQVFALR